MSKKSQISIDTVVALAILAIAIAVLFYLIFPVVKEALVGSAEESECEWGLVLHAITKMGDWSLIPPQCSAQRPEISLSSLKEHEKEAKARINVYKKDKTKYAEILRFFNDPNNQNQVNEWALNKIVATYMKNCWTKKVSRGKLPIFSQWQGLISWGTEKAPGTGEDAVNLYIARMHEPPVLCILCSRLKFSEDLINAFGSRKYIDSFDVWLRYNYPSFDERSYYEIITEGQSSVKDPFTLRYPGYNLEFPLAILYEKIYETRVLLGEKRDIDELNYVKVVPYTNERITGSSKTGGEACAFILD